MSDGLPPRVRAFVLEHIDSIELLEILLFLAAHPGAAFTAEAVSERLRSSPSSVRNRLDALSRRDLIERTASESFRFAAAAPHRTIVDEVRAAYRERPGRVVSLVYSRPSEVVTVFAEPAAPRPRRGTKRGGEGGR